MCSPKMPRPLIAFVLSSLVLPLAACGGANAPDASEGPDGPTAPAAPASAASVTPAPPAAASSGAQAEGSAALQRIMTESQQHAMTMTGNVDTDFAAMMTMHHQAGIQMVDVLEQHGSNADLKALAASIKMKQQGEIEKLAPHASHSAHGAAPAEGATAGSEGSNALHQAMMGSQHSMAVSGDVDRDFASMMAMHHQSAIKMADVYLQHGKDAELRALAAKIKAEQGRETEQLQRFAQ